MKPKTVFDKSWEPSVQSVELSHFLNTSIVLDVLREDEIHPFVSGNKFRKLKYNFKRAQQNGLDRVITFGGAYSNHIAAVAAAGKLLGVQTIGVIRGDELVSKPLNATLSFAVANDMQLHFVSRADYTLKERPDFIDSLQAQFGASYIIPEGGTNALAVHGCSEIITPNLNVYDYICVAVGTGGTLAGIINGAQETQHCIGYSALKGTFQQLEVAKYTNNFNYKIIDDYCFGGYAKIDLELIRFINVFKKRTKIPLDPIYTGKMMYGIFDGIGNGYFNQNSRILAVHTGGLQGISGMNSVLKKKNIPQIE